MAIVTHRDSVTFLNSLDKNLTSVLGERGKCVLLDTAFMKVFSTCKQI